MDTIKAIKKFLFNISNHFLALIGILFIFYGLGLLKFISISNEGESIINIIGKILTLVSVIITSLSVYFSKKVEEPERISKIFVAPLVITFILGYIVYKAVSKTPISDHVVNGVAILGLSGSLFRTFRFKERTEMPSMGRIGG